MVCADRKKITQERVDGLMAANIEQTKTTVVEYIIREKMEMVYHQRPLSVSRLLESKQILLSNYVQNPQPLPKEKETNQKITEEA